MYRIEAVTLISTSTTFPRQQCYANALQCYIIRKSPILICCYQRRKNLKNTQNALLLLRVKNSSTRALQCYTIPALPYLVFRTKYLGSYVTNWSHMSRRVSGERQLYKNITVEYISFSFKAVSEARRDTLWRSWLRQCATSRKVAGSIPYGVTGIFHWHKTSGRPMALGSNHPLTDE